MKKMIILAMHGAPPLDYPREELAEFFRLHSLMERARKDQNAATVERYELLDQKIRNWPRTPQNDPFFAGASALAEALHSTSGVDVLLAFNEFCAPSLESALELAAEETKGRVVVITPMVTPGGEHSEKDIPIAIRAAQQQYPQVEFRYVWPLDLGEVAKFLTSQAARHLED